MQLELHHLSKRKRIHKKFEEYPSKKFWIRFLDRLLVVIAVVGPLVSIPQLWAVYSTHDAANISFFSWGLWALFNLVWLTYGIVHKEKPIIITYILWFFVNSAMAVAALIF